LISNRDVLAAIGENPRTAIVVAPNGRVAELVPFGAAPSAEAFIAFTRTRVPGTRFRLVPQAHLSEAQLEALLSEIAAGPGPDRSPGPAIPTIESKLHPFATARAIAEAITKLIVR
jgi:hypothetical protein